MSDYEMNKSPSVLVIDDDPNDLRKVVLEVQKRFLDVCAEARSIEEAAGLIRRRHFDIIFCGHKSWDEGIQLYVNILNHGHVGCQFILFVANPSELGPAFLQYFKTVPKPDVSGLVRAADWPPL